MRASIEEITCNGKTYEVTKEQFNNIEKMLEDAELELRDKYEEQIKEDIDSYLEYLLTEEDDEE